jgi:hypothetical protein
VWVVSVHTRWDCRSDQDSRLAEQEVVWDRAIQSRWGALGKLAIAAVEVQVMTAAAGEDRKVSSHRASSSRKQSGPGPRCRGRFSV